MSDYTEKYELPTRGLLKEGSVSSVTLRNMTTKEEKMLLGSTVDVLDKIMKKCIVEPEKFDFKIVSAPDKHYILMRLRILSYGNDYYVSAKCPACGSTNEYKVNLEELEVHYLKDDYKEPYDEFELPKSKKRIALKIPLMEDIDDADKRVKRYKRKFPNADGDIGYIYRMGAQIAEIDDEVPDQLTLDMFVEGLHTTDSSYIKHRIGKLKVGYETEVEVECKNPACSNEFEFDIGLGPEFFRTRFDD